MKRKPYLLLFVVAILLLIASFFSSNENTLDINVHDTYYVTTEKDLSIILLMFTAVLGLIYLVFDLLKISMISKLSKIHVYGTLILLFVFSIYFFKMQIPIKPENYYSITNYPEDYSFHVLMTLLMIIFLQILFIINIFVSIIKKLCNSAAQ